jgi:hypothetical protein
MNIKFFSAFKAKSENPGDATSHIFVNLSKYKPSIIVQKKNLEKNMLELV